MKKTAPKKRPSDTNSRMHSILGDVIAITNRPIIPPKKTAGRRKSN